MRFSISVALLFVSNGVGCARPRPEPQTQPLTKSAQHCEPVGCREANFSHSTPLGIFTPEIHETSAEIVLPFDTRRGSVFALVSDEQFFSGAGRAVVSQVRTTSEGYTTTLILEPPSAEPFSMVGPFPKDTAPTHAKEIGTLQVPPPSPRLSDIPECSRLFQPSRTMFAGSRSDAGARRLRSSRGTGRRIGGV